MINRESILKEAINRCLNEMYKMSQPSIKLSKINNDPKAYEHHYLSEENFQYIQDMYLKAYCIENPWKEHCDKIKEYLINGGYKCEPSHKWIKIEGLKIDDDSMSKVLMQLKNCKDSYSFDNDSIQFYFAIANYSPTSNKKLVIDYWKSKGIDINIKEIKLE